MVQKINLLLLLALLSGCANHSTNPSQVKADSASSPQTVVEADPFLWLEDVEGTAAIDWVKARNKKSLDVLEKHPSFAALYENNKTTRGAFRRF